MGTLAFRGHVREARRLVLERGEHFAFTSLPGELALFGGFPADSAEPLFRRWVRERPLWPPGAIGALSQQLTYVFPWWAGRGDTASLRLAGMRMDSAAGASKENYGREVGRYGSNAARAYLALARHDTVAALAGLAALPHDISLSLPDQLVESRLLVARGRDRDALAILSRELPWIWVSPLRVMWSLDRARVTERLGDRERAITDYQYVADAWRHGDPEVQPYVQESRAALQRLTGEIGR
jgi:hypothetical protein